MNLNKASIKREMAKQSAEYLYEAQNILEKLNEYGFFALEDFDEMGADIELKCVISSLSLLRSLALLTAKS